MANNSLTCHKTNEKRLVDANVANADSCKTAKIKSPFVKVIVTGSEDKPYYEILYYDPSDGKFHIGYSSFSLNTVFHYLSEVFDIADVPTVDAVEVVRCKDCKHYEDHKRKIYENCVRDGRFTPMKPDDFCSYGERREGE